jgi:hypothetical protein
MSSTLSILKLALLAIVVAASSMASPVAIVPIQQCGGVPDTVLVDSFDGQDGGMAAADLEDSDEPLVGRRPARRSMHDPIKWRVTPVNVTDAGWPSVPIPPPLAG